MIAWGINFSYFQESQFNPDNPTPVFAEKNGGQADKKWFIRVSFLTYGTLQM